MIAPANPEFPFQMSWKQAFAVYVARLRLFLLVFLISTVAGISWLSVSSWWHLSPEGRTRSAYAVLAIFVVFGLINRAVFLAMRLRLQTQKSWDELRQVQAIANRQLVAHHRPPLPELIAEAKKKRKTDRLFPFASVEEAREVACVRQAIVRGVIDAMEMPANDQRRDAHLLSTAGSFDPSL